jgi:hypothetical protein
MGVVGAAFCSDLLLKDLDDDIEAESLNTKTSTSMHRSTAPSALTGFHRSH